MGYDSSSCSTQHASAIGVRGWSGADESGQRYLADGALARARLRTADELAFQRGLDRADERRLARADRADQRDVHRAHLVVDVDEAGYAAPERLARSGAALRLHGEAGPEQW